MLISSTEPDHIKALGKLSQRPEAYGADILIVAKGRKVGVQRKAFPEDFAASLRDGRLSTQLPLLSQLESFVVLVGEGRWTPDGQLYHERINLTKSAVESALLTMSIQFGVHTRWLKDEDEFCEWVTRLEQWVKKPDHYSLMRRPKPQSGGWGGPTKQDWLRHLLQSFPGIGPKMADTIMVEFGGVPLRWSVLPEEMLKVRGLGKVTVDGMYRYLDGPGS